MWLNVHFAMNHTMFAPAPKDWRSLVGVYHLEDHLLESIFTTGEGTDQGVHMEYDEDTAIAQQPSTHMASGDSI